MTWNGLKNMNVIEYNKNCKPSYIGRGEVLYCFGKKLLLSYGVPVILIDRRKKIHRLWDGYSRITGEHIKRFCGLSKEEYLALPVEKSNDAFVNIAANYNLG